MLERIAGGPIALQRKPDLALGAAVEVLAHQDDLLRRRQHAQLAAPPELEGELAEDLVAESMEGADDRVVQTDRRVDVDPLLHLGGGAFGEGHRQNLVRFRRARGDEMDDARGEDVGLPGARAGHDEQRTGSVLDR